MSTKNHNIATTGTPQFKITRSKRGFVKRIGGKLVWLAPLNRPDLALERAIRKMAEFANKSHHIAPVANNNVTLGVVGELFLSSKFAKMNGGELDPRTFHGYETGVQIAVDYFGYDTIVLNIPAARWQQYRTHLADKYDIYTLARHVGAVRALSKWAGPDGNEYIDRPFRFGTEFKLPSQKALRASKRDAGDRTYTPAHVKTILEKADPVMKAMFLLSINGGIGNTDISKLSDSNVRKDRIEFERSKTEVARIIPLWPETAKAIKEARAVRPKASKPELDDRIFLTDRGFPYVRNNMNAEGRLTSTTDKIATVFWKGMKALGVPRTFYDGRRTFQTIGDEVGPPHVVKAIMGHTPRSDDMSSRYRQHIYIKQVEAVINHVRKRLRVSSAKSSSSGPAKTSAARASKAKDQPAAIARKPQRHKGENAK